MIGERSNLFEILSVVAESRNLEFFCQVTCNNNLHAWWNMTWHEGAVLLYLEVAESDLPLIARFVQG